MYTKIYIRILNILRVLQKKKNSESIRLDFNVRYF